MRSSRSMIFGAHRHISSTGGWSARKSPPSTVSSKCIHSLNPCCRAISLVALMPPCAQTLCERLTGTIENKSTPTPSSASLMVQARPAKPPPTTMTRFLLGIAIDLSVAWASRPCFRHGRDAHATSLLPHLFAPVGALCVDELQVMFQVIHG